VNNVCPIDGAELAPGTTICRGCDNGLRVDLKAVPDRLDDLDLTLSRQHSRAGEGISDPESPPVDYDVAASDARRELVQVVTVYARRWLHDVAPIGPERLPAVEKLYTTTKGKAALIAGYRALGAAGWAPLLAAELRDALTAAQHAIDRPVVVQFAGWCPGIAHATGVHAPVYVVEGQPFATCRACGHVVDVEENRATTLAMASATIERATAAQLAAAFGLPSATIRSWAHRRWLTLAGDGTYLVAEVRALSLGLRPVTAVPSPRVDVPTPPEGIPCQS
jgi:hypothetical protein